MEGEKITKIEGKYVFPNSVAKFMKGISQRTQYEASMMAMVCILAGLIFMTIYIPFFTDLSTLMKIGTIVNTLAGMLFLGSWLVTTYQQYYAYLIVMDIIKDDKQTL